MQKHKRNIFHHTKKLVHHSGHLANKHKHILLGYMHVCLVIIGLGAYHMFNSMYAQETGEVIIVEENVIVTTTNEEITTEESIDTNNESPTETTETILEDTGTVLNLSGEIIENSGSIFELSGELNVITGDISENTGSILELSGEIMENSGIIVELSGEINAITGDISENTGSILELSGNTNSGNSMEDNEKFLELSGNITENTGSIQILSDTTSNIQSLIQNNTGSNETGIINNPSDIDNLEVWFDANKINSIILSGNTVQVRKDRNGGANKAFMTNENKCPLYISGVVNNNSAVFFDNIDDGMQTTIQLTTGYSMFLVYNKEYIADNFASVVGANKNWFIGFQKDNFVFFNSGIINIPNYRDNNIFKIVNIISSDSGTNIFINNKEVSTTSSALFPDGNLGLGKSDDNHFAFGGYIAEIIIYKKILTKNEINAISKYLGNKYYPFVSKGAPESNTEKTNTISEDKKTEPTTTETNTTQNKTVNEEQISIKPISEEQISETNTTGNIPDLQKTTNETIEYFTTAFQKGEQNEKIIRLKEFLKDYGNYQGEINSTYDDETINAIYEFQTKEGILNDQNNNIKVHGYLGPSTRNKLNEVFKNWNNNKIGQQQETNTQTEETAETNNSIENTTNSGENTEIQQTANEIPKDKKQVFKEKLLSLGFKEENKANHKIWRGKENIDLANSSGTIEETTVVTTDDTAQVEITLPEQTIIKKKNGNIYTGTFQKAQKEAAPKQINGITTIETIKAGADEPIILEDNLGNSKNATIKIGLPDTTLGEKIIVSTSQDGNTWEYLDTVEAKTDGSGTFASFQTNHFTIFSLGVWTGTFMINNDDEITTGYNVTLSTNITGATHMKFGNTPAERDSASRITYNATYPRTLTGADGEKTVYAMFSGNGTTAYIQDTILLDISTSKAKNGLQLHIDGSYNGSTFYDLSENNYLATSINNVFNTTRGGQATMGFNGTNQYINIAQPVITTYPFTISAWVKPDRITGTQGIIFKGRSTAATRYYGINLNNARFQITARNTKTRTANGTINAQVGQWYHVVGVFASNTSRTIYVNGVQGNSSTNNVALDTTSQHRTIGKYAGTATNYFSGNIDEVRIYNKVLSTQEVQNLYFKEPNFSNTTTYTTTPTLQGTSLDPNIQIYVGVNGNTYPATISGDVRKTTITDPLPAGTYDVTLQYENIYGVTGTQIYPNSLTVNDLRQIEYNPDSETFDNVVATLTGLESNYTITNNNGNNQYTFTGNGHFTFQIEGPFGTQYEVTATVDWIKKGSLTGTNLIFYEDEILNNGGIQNIISFQLSGDTFNSNAPTNGSITMSGIPTGLTPNYYLSGTQTLIVGLSGTATSHANSDDINNIEIIFGNGAFTNSQENEIQNSTITNISIDFLDPYVGLQIYPSDDTMIDADTDAANGCADGVCQENNYGAMTYLCASDFGSKVLMRFSTASIPTGSKITSAKLRLTRYYINTQTPGMSFNLRPIINNPGWIEGTQANATALAGEVNYKMRKRQQESWYNGNIGLIAGIDYSSTNITNITAFTGSQTSNITQEFDLNSYGIQTVQNWLDNPSTNNGIILSDSDNYWLCLYSKENTTTANRPMLTVTYAIDIDAPKINSLTPNNNATDIGLYDNLYITFNENIKAFTGYTITIKRLPDNSTFETIDATSNQVTINNNVVTINPNNSFENYTGYYVEVQSGAFRDNAGNSFTGIIGSGIWKFTTVNTLLNPTVTNNSVTNISDTSTTASAEITSLGSSNIIERGFYRSTTNGFNDGAGTKVSETGNRSTIGTYTLPLSNLPAGTRIYFKGFARNSEGVGYSLQSGFLTKPGQPIFKPTTYIDNDGFTINRNTTTGATSYKVYLSTNSSFSSYITGYNPKIISLTKESIAGLQRETTYYYKIQATNAAGDSVFSETRNTTTTYLPMPRVRLKFEETAGSVAFDSSQNYNDGILLGGTLMNQTGIDGKAFRYDGINDDTSIVDFDYGPDLTVSFRFKTTDNGNDVHLFSHGDDGATNSINILLNNSDQTLRTYINGQQSILNLNGTTYPTLIDNQRHLYTLTIDDDGEIAGKKKASVYIDGQFQISDSSINSGVYNPINNITLARRSTNETNSFYNGYLDDIRIYNKTLSAGEVYNLYAAFVDTTPPTAYIQYSQGSGTCYNGDIITTLTGYSEPIVITNNGGSNSYTFTDNGTFTFTFRDEGFNTGEVTATVDRICLEPVSIGGPAMVDNSITPTSDLQIVEAEFPDYFWINDPIGSDNGYYTTISITDFSGTYGNISHDTISLKGIDINTLTGTINPRVTINSGLNNYQTIGDPITYIKRDSGTNYNIKGKYGNKPWLKFNIPAYLTIDDYHATINYTLYEN